MKNYYERSTGGNTAELSKLYRDSTLYRTFSCVTSAITGGAILGIIEQIEKSSPHIDLFIAGIVFGGVSTLLFQRLLYATQQKIRETKEEQLPSLFRERSALEQKHVQYPSLDDLV